MTFGYGAVAQFTTDTEYRITHYQVESSANPSLTIDRALTWTGDKVTAIIDANPVPLKSPRKSPGNDDG